MNIQICIKKIKKYISMIYNLKKTHSKVYNVRHCSDINFSWYNRIGGSCWIKNVELGRYTYIGDNCHICNTKIGAFSSLGSNIRIVSGNHPTSNYVSTHPLFYSNFQLYDIRKSARSDFEEYSFVDKEKKWHVVIGNDVWVGDNVLILNGVSIGDGAVIATGAVVTGDVRPYAIVGGVPAQTLKYRFEEEIRKELIEVKWWDQTQEWIGLHIQEFSEAKKFIKTVCHDQ